MNPTLYIRAFGRACLALGALCIAPLASAQAVSTGTIDGRVLNITSGKYVKNARVTVDGTTLEAFSGEFGAYRLLGVPAGQASVRAVYGGIPPVTRRVAVASGAISEQNFNVGTNVPCSYLNQFEEFGVQWVPASRAGSDRHQPSSPVPAPTSDPAASLHCGCQTVRREMNLPNLLTRLGRLPPAPWLSARSPTPPRLLHPPDLPLP